MNEINNNYNSQTFGTNRTEKKMELTKEEKTKQLVEYSIDLLLDMAEREVPENGSFKKVRVIFELPHTNNEGMIIIEPDEKDIKTGRYITTAAKHQHADRLISNYMFKGTKNDVMEYLKVPENRAKVIESINTLSDKTDEYYSSL